MKHISFAALLILVSCGKQTHNKYIENPYDDAALTSRISDIEARLASLETARSNLFYSIESLETRLAENTGNDQAMLDELKDLESSYALVTEQLIELLSKKHHSKKK